MTPRFSTSNIFNLAFGDFVKITLKAPNKGLAGDFGLQQRDLVKCLESINLRSA